MLHKYSVIGLVAINISSVNNIRKLSTKLIEYWCIRNMSNKNNSLLDKIEDSQIDSGRFKYILIKVNQSSSDSEENSKYIVRGYSWAAFHGDIYDKVVPPIEANNGLDCECVGGGRILHKPDEKTIEVFGYSQGFGKADHSISCDILKKKYSDYIIKWFDGGY